MGGMTISPDMSEFGETNGMPSQASVPLTPAGAAEQSMPVGPTPDLGEQYHAGIAASRGMPQQQHQQQHQPAQQYATMPNKHYQATPAYGYAQPQPKTEYNTHYSQPSSAYTSPHDPTHPAWQ